MSLARAFTTRRQKVFGGGDSSSKPNRSNTVKGGPIRSKISGPVELIHTTNMLSYNAPNIQQGLKTVTSTSSSLRSDDDLDKFPTAASSPPTSPDSPWPPSDNKETAEPNHLSSFFTAPSQSSSATESAIIPKRAPSNSKKSHESLDRKQSISRLSQQSGRTVSTKASFSFSRSSSTSTNTASSTHHSYGSHQTPKAMSPPPLPTSSNALPAPLPSSRQKEAVISDSHPFSQELAQVSELAEEFSPALDKTHVVDQEEQDLLACGLKKFSPEDYLADIQGLINSFFTDTHAPASAPVWI